MKKFLAALLAVCLCLSFTSCLSIRGIVDLIDDFKYIASLSKVERNYNVDAELDYEFDETIKEQIEDRFKKIDEIIESGNEIRFASLAALFEQQYNDINYIDDQSTLAYIAFSKDTTDTKASDRYDELQNLRIEYVTRLQALYRPIYESPLKDVFYSGWTEEDIQDALKVSDAATGEMAELQSKVNAEVTRYQALDQNSATYLSDSAKAYDTIVKYNREIARKAGFDSYPEYAYKFGYGRDYSPEDAQKMYDYVKNYIVPMANQILQSLRSYVGLRRIVNQVDQLERDSVDPEKMVQTLTPYYEKLAGKFEEGFKSFQEHYYVSSSETGLSNAYTSFLTTYGFPVCFFGPDNQALSTYTHEQGHYNAFFTSNTAISSIDLCESQSQGNEWLYVAYRFADTNEIETDYIAKYLMLNSVNTILLATCCDAFEQYVYAHPELTVDDYDDAFIKVARDMDAYDYLSNTISIAPEAYWHYAIVANSMYYLSYAVSCIPAAEIYMIAQEQGFEKAVEQFTKLCSVQRDTGFVEALTAADLGSPFEDETYKHLKQFFTK